MAMKLPDWLASIFGEKTSSPAPAGIDRAEHPAAGEDAQHAVEEQVAAEWKVGDVILDLYEVKQVHAGGMGLVYRVHHRGWNIDLAVKSPRSGYFRTEAHKQNFSRECETWINLGLHPHVASCYYVRNLGGIPRVFAEYVEGGSLKDWIDSRRLYQGGPHAALTRILDIAIQMAWGLHYAHEQRLIHQDVKPANVLMMPDGVAKITDFGLAKARASAGEPIVADASRSILVSTGGMTPAYCSPEQANKQPLSRKADIWSWAVSALEMLVGEVCWQSGLAAPHLLDRLNAVRAEGLVISDPPPELLELLGQCFTTEPGERPENFRAVADRLNSIYHAFAGKEYAREYPKPAELRADALNNRAASMLDLGRAAEAEDLFAEALAMEPDHPHLTYNLGLHLWHSARETDYTIVQALDRSRLNWPGISNAPYLLGLIHLERRDATGAIAALTAAEKIEPGGEIREALAKARQLETCGLVKTFEGHEDNVECVAITADGRLALSGAGAILRLWDLGAGICLRTFQQCGYSDVVQAVALSADGCRALSVDDENLRLWNVSSGECLKTFGGKNAGGRLNSVALSTDGRRAVASAFLTDRCANKFK